MKKTNNYSIKDGIITVKNGYANPDEMNKYLSNRQLKSDSYTDEEIAELLESVCFYLDSRNDLKRIQAMTKRI